MGQLPLQSLERWVLEQRVRRSRDVLEPRPYTEADHEQLRADLTAAWRALERQPLVRRFTGRLPR
jgi:hypothetical protein